MAFYGYVAKPVTTFISNIFTKSRYAQWKGRGWERYVSQYHEDPSWCRWDAARIITGQDLTWHNIPPAKEWIMNSVRGWDKDMQNDIRNWLATPGNVKEKPRDPPKPPVEVHKPSASYKPVAKTQIITKARDIKNAVPPKIQTSLAKISAIPKTPLYILIGAGVLFLIFNLTKTKGGAV